MPVSLKEAASVLGISAKELERLEHGAYDNPPDHTMEECMTPMDITVLGCPRRLHFSRYGSGGGFR